MKLAKEELSRYSKDLERQVQNRTREIHSNITALKKAQDQLRRLSAGIMASQEKERYAISRELHDELGQALTALRMDSVWMQERLKESDAEASQRALTMCQLIDKNIEDVRGMAFRLCPGVLDDLGIVDALDWFTTDFERRTEITCVFDNDKVPPLSETVATQRSAGGCHLHVGGVSRSQLNGQDAFSVADFSKQRENDGLQG